MIPWLLERKNTTVVENGATRSWIDQIGRFHKIDLERLHKLPVICAGVTLGPAVIVRRYLDAFADLARSAAGIVGGSAGFDQGIHNIVLREKRVPNVQILKVGNTLVGHLCSNWAEVFDLDLTRGLVGKITDEVVSIVHFYDRKMQLVSYYSERFDVICEPHAAAAAIARCEAPIHVR